VTALQRLLEARADGGGEAQDPEPLGDGPLGEPDPVPAAAEPVGAQSQPAPAARSEPLPAPEPEPEPPVDHYDDLAAREVISLLGSLEHEDLLALRDYERLHAGRRPVVGAIESVLARRGQPYLG